MVVEKHMATVSRSHGSSSARGPTPQVHHCLATVVAPHTAAPPLVRLDLPAEGVADRLEVHCVRNHPRLQCAPNRARARPAQRRRARVSGRVVAPAPPGPQGPGGRRPRAPRTGRPCRPACSHGPVEEHLGGHGEELPGVHPGVGGQQRVATPLHVLVLPRAHLDPPVLLLGWDSGGVPSTTSSSMSSLWANSWNTTLWPRSGWRASSGHRVPGDEDRSLAGPPGPGSAWAHRSSALAPARHAGR